MALGWTLLKSHQREFVKAYARALWNTPQIFRRLAFRRRTLEEELQEALLRGSLRKAFSSFDLLMLGLGIVIGSGWAQLTGTAAQQFAGSSIILSYVFAGLASLLAAVCYAELCIEYPVSGGAFSYIMVTFGEFAAFVTLAGVLLEYGLGMAAVARGFSTNLAALLNLPTKDIRVWVNGEVDGHSFDFVAAGIVIFMSLLLSLGVRESAHFISGMTVIKLCLILSVAVVGYTQGAWDNPQAWPPSHFSPFLLPAWDVDGIFLGASSVFFSATGWDAIGNAAEEVKSVASLPMAILGTVLTSTLAYFMLSLSLVILVYPNIGCPAPSIVAPPCTVTFISAFVGGHQLKAMQYVVSLAALFGIVTSLTVGLFSASRIVMVASRDWLLPPFLARISKRTQTPLVAQMVLGVIIALLALLVEVEAATSLVSFGTLVALWLVSNAQLFRRYFPDTQLRFTRYGTVETAPAQEIQSRALGRKLSLRARKALVVTHMLLLNAVAIALTIYYAQTTAHVDRFTCPPPDTTSDTAPPPPPPSPALNAMPTVDPYAPAWLATCDPNEANKRHGVGPLWFLMGWLLVTLSLQLCCPLEYRPEGWHVPWWLMPWLPSAAIGLLCFSVGALPRNDYWKTGIYFGALLGFYLLFSLPMSYLKHSRVDYSAADELNVIELVYANGRWQPRLGTTFAFAPKPSVQPMGSVRPGSSAMGSARPSMLRDDLAVKLTVSSPVPAAALLSNGSAVAPSGASASSAATNSAGSEVGGTPRRAASRDSGTPRRQGRVRGSGGGGGRGRDGGRGGGGGVQPGGSTWAPSSPMRAHSQTRRSAALPPMQEGDEV